MIQHSDICIGSKGLTHIHYDIMITGMIHITFIPNNAIAQIKAAYPELILKDDEIFYLADNNKIIHTY